MGYLHSPFSPKITGIGAFNQKYGLNLTPGDYTVKYLRSIITDPSIERKTLNISRRQYDYIPESENFTQRAFVYGSVEHTLHEDTVIHMGLSGGSISNAEIGVFTDNFDLDYGNGMDAPYGFVMSHTGECQSNPGIGGVHDEDYNSRARSGKVSFSGSLCR